MEALDLETHPLDISISGVNGTVISSNYMIRIKLQSRLNSCTATIECIVTDQITNKIPAISSGRDKFNFRRNIRLVDPRFHMSSDIDLLIEAELFWNLILDSTISTASKVHLFHASVTNMELYEHVSRAWQMDDISARLDNYTIEEDICERHFLDNVSQNSYGRYTIKLPVREQMLNNIGDSREAALKRLRGIVSSAILRLKFNTRRFSINIYRWDICGA